MIHYDISPLISCKLSKLMSLPRFIRVNEFTEESLAEFRYHMELACHTGQPVVPIVIDSGGGSVYSLLGMVDIIESAKHLVQVATIAEGKAMSCGAALLSCGDEGFRFVAPNATVLIHDVWSEAAGKNPEIQSEAKESQRLNEHMYRLMDRNCGQPDGYFQSLVHDLSHADCYLTPQECKKHKLANHVGVPEMGVTVSVDYAFGLVKAEKPSPRKRTRKAGGK